MNETVRSMKFRFFALAAPLCLALVSGACNPEGKKGPPPCEPDDHVFESIRVLVQPAEMLNPNEDGEALSVQLHVYQLKGDESVQMIDFETVWEQGGEVAFGDDFISEEEVTIYPGRNDLIELVPDPEARFIVAAAIFREPLGQDWFRLYEVPRYHGHSVCSAEKKKQPWPDPCFFIVLDRYLVDGGHKPPTGWDKAAQTLECPGPPLRNPPIEKKDDGGKKKKKKRKKLKDRKAPEAPEQPEGPAQPEAPAKPEAPSAPGR